MSEHPLLEGWIETGQIRAGDSFNSDSGVTGRVLTIEMITSSRLPRDHLVLVVDAGSIEVGDTLRVWIPAA